MLLMATFYSTGPVLIWVGPQIIKPTPYTPLPTVAPVFLGTAEVSPQGELRRQYQPAYNDMSGAVPFDLNFLGEDAVLAIDLTRWNENVYARLSDAPRQLTSPTGISRGSYPVVGPGVGMGALMAHDGLTTTVYMVFPYGFTTAVQNAPGRSYGMPVGYRFHGGSLINDKLHQMGSKYRKLHLTFQFAPVYNNVTTLMTLYDHTIPAAMALPSINVTGA